MSAQSAAPVELGLPLPSAAACEVRDGCITCGDVAVAMEVLSLAGADAVCRDPSDDHTAGRTELVATELVGRVRIGDRLLVHAGVALERLQPTFDNAQTGETS